MSIFKITNISYKTSPPVSGLWLGILDPESIPPHLVVLFNNQLFNATHRNFFCGTEADYLFRYLNKNQKNSIWIKLKQLLPDHQIKEILTECYNQEEGLKPGQTCLQPALKAFSKIFNLSIPKDQLLPDLLEILKFNDLNEMQVGVFHGKIRPETVKVGGYTSRDIEIAINRLKKRDAERKDLIS